MIFRLLRAVFEDKELEAMKVIASLQRAYGGRMIFEGGEGSWYSAYLDKSDRIRVRLHRSMQECNIAGRNDDDNPNIEYCMNGPVICMKSGIETRLLSKDRDDYKDIDRGARHDKE